MKPGRCTWRGAFVTSCWTWWLMLQQSCSPAHGQSFAEVGSVLYGGTQGAGSILPYSSPSRAVGSSVGWVDPVVLNVNRRRRSRPDPNQGPIYVGPTPAPPKVISQAELDRRSQSGPVFNNVFRNWTPGRSPSRPGPYYSASVPAGGGPAFGSGSGVEIGGGRLVDPPNRSSLWREGMVGSPVYLQDNHLNCGAQHMPVFNLDGEESMNCGVCGDSPIGPQNHVIGGRLIRIPPIVSRAYRAGGLVPVTFFLNQTIVPGVDRVSFSLCPVNRPLRDVSSDCMQEGEGVRMVGWDRFYLPARPGVHRVYLYISPLYNCRHCVLQWRWQSSQTLSRRQCNRQPWLRACYLPIEYVNCADISISAPAYTNALSRYLASSRVNS